jgi:glycosyltransferase involved in cell wall biosynthesis
MIRALVHSWNQQRVIFHFIDATFIFVSAWVLLARKPTVYYLPGPLDLDASGATQPRRERAKRFRVGLTLLRQAACSGRFAICCETTHVQAHYNQLLGRAAAHLIPYAIEPVRTEIQGKSLRRALGISEDAFVALLFGTRRAGKDYRTVIEAARLAGPSVLLLFVGALISENDPVQIASDLGFAQARFVNEFVGEDAMPLYFAASDVVVLPYEGDFSRGSGILLHACRFGRVPIVADTGYLAEFVRQYACGLVYAQSNPLSLATAFEKARRFDAAEQDQLKKGLRAAVEDHSWARVIDKYLALYRSLLDKDAIDSDDERLDDGGLRNSHEPC